MQQFYITTYVLLFLFFSTFIQAHKIGFSEDKPIIASTEKINIDKLLITNKSLNVEKSYSPLQLTLLLFKLENVENNLTIQQQFNRVENPNHSTVKLIQKGLLDDSIMAIYHNITFIKNTSALTNVWEVHQVERAFQCRRTNTETFTKDFCS